MVSKVMDTKIRTLIKAFLVMNRGRKYTAKQICEFINNGEFHLNKGSANPKQVSHMIRHDQYALSNMLYNVQVEKKGNLSYYWVS